MRIVKPLLFLGIALAPAIAAAEPARRPLASRDGRPAVGNIGQRGRTERRPEPPSAARTKAIPIDGRPEHAATRARTIPLAQTALRTAQEAAAVELRPLVTAEERAAVGNIGQRGRATEVKVKIEAAAVPAPPSLIPLRTRLESGLRPLVNEEQRPAVGNCVGKCPSE